MPKTVEDTIEQLFFDMPFEQLIGWAFIYGVPHDEDMWLDDEWPDKEGELRVQVTAAMLRAQGLDTEEYKRRVLGEFVKEPKEPKLNGGVDL